MEWLDSIIDSINFIEEHLLEDIDAGKVSKAVNISPFYFQKYFSIMTNISISQYIKGRRLYLAALDLCSKDESVINIAYKYLYETPESFTKAFTRFHGVNPTHIKEDTKKIHSFLPLRISINIMGGENMNYKIEKMNSFKIIGFKKKFKGETSYQDIPKFWSEVFNAHHKALCGIEEPKSVLEKALVDNKVGEFGICINNNETCNEFDYLIGGYYKGGKVPNELEIVEIPSKTFAKFLAVGPIPGSLQSINTKVFKEWLPNNKEYTFDGNISIEWYSSKGKPSDDDYESAVWIPIKKNK